MILITGAGGKTGRAVIRALVSKGEPVRALVHRSDQTQRLESLGVQQALAGDMNSRSTMARAVQGVRAIYHICPNVSPDELSIGQTVIAAARVAGIEHFVYHSVLHPQTESMPHHWQKLRIEEQLLESGLSYTILQPTVYMQNILVHWKKILNEGIYPVPYPAETRLSYVDLDDVGQVAAIVLTESGHANATYQLVGTPGFSQDQVAGILSQQLGRQVRVTTVPLETWERQARRSGMGDYQVDTLLKMFRYYARYGLCGNPQVLSWLLLRPPLTLDNFIENTVHQQVQQEPI